MWIGAVYFVPIYAVTFAVGILWEILFVFTGYQEEKVFELRGRDCKPVCSVSCWLGSKFCGVATGGQKRRHSWCYCILPPRQPPHPSPIQNTQFLPLLLRFSFVARPSPSFVRHIHIDQDLNSNDFPSHTEGQLRLIFCGVALWRYPQDPQNPLFL